MYMAEQQYKFFEDVWEVVRLIPRGRVTSYGAIARYLGTAKSSRMLHSSRASFFLLPLIQALLRMYIIQRGAS